MLCIRDAVPIAVVAFVTRCLAINISHLLACFHVGCLTEQEAL